MFITWDQFYNYLGIKDFIYFISSPVLQDQLLGAKLVFIFFTIFFFCAIIWFYLNSSYLQTHVMKDSAKPPVFQKPKKDKKWQEIFGRTESGSESELKLAIIEADDYVYDVLDEAGFQGDSFEELVKSAGKKLTADSADLLEAHALRNAIVYDINYPLTAEAAKKILSVYEGVIKSASAL